MKGKKGFTLVELVAVIAMIGIIGTGVMKFFINQNDIFYRVNSETKIQDEARIILSAIEEDLRVGKNITIEINRVSFIKGGEAYAYEKDGKVLKRISGANVHVLSEDVTEFNVEPVTAEKKQFKVILKISNNKASDEFSTIITPRN